MQVNAWRSRPESRVEHQNERSEKNALDVIEWNKLESKLSMFLSRFEFQVPNHNKYARNCRNDSISS